MASLFLQVEQGLDVRRKARVFTFIFTIEAGMDIESKESAWKAELELSEVPRELSNAEGWFPFFPRSEA